MVPDTCRMFIHFSSSLPGASNQLLSTAATESWTKKRSTIHVGLIRAPNGEVPWALFSSGAARSIKYHRVQFTPVGCFDLLQKIYFFSLLSFLCKACLAVGIFHIFSRESHSSMMQDQEINISVYSWAKYCKLSIKLYQLAF